MLSDAAHRNKEKREQQKQCTTGEKVRTCPSARKRTSQGYESSTARCESWRRNELYLIISERSHSSNDFSHPSKPFHALAISYRKNSVKPITNGEDWQLTIVRPGCRVVTMGPQRKRETHRNHLAFGRHVSRAVRQAQLRLQRVEVGLELRLLLDARGLVLAAILTVLVQLLLHAGQRVVGLARLEPRERATDPFQQLIPARHDYYH